MERQSVGEEVTPQGQIIGYDPNTGKAVYAPSSAPPPPPSPGGFTGAQSSASAASATTPPTGTGVLGAIKEGVGASAEGLGRMGSRVASNVAQPFVHPLDTMIAIGHLPMSLLNAQGAEFTKAKDAYDKGDKGKAALHALAYLAPIIGPMLDDMATRTANGEGPEVAGDLTSMMLPAGVEHLPSAVTIGGKGARTMEGRALQFAADNGVPVDLGTASGNNALRHMQKAAENTTLSGAYIGKRGQEAVSGGLATLGEQLASKAGRGQPTTMLAAGEEAAGTMGGKIKQLTHEADAAYEQIRQAEAQGHVVGVNIKLAKAQLKPVYDQLVRESKLAQPQGATAKALIAMDRLMQAPDVAPLSVADGALSEIKAALRKSKESEPWSRGTGLLSQTVKSLDKEVMETAKIAKLDDALTKGRTATMAKYDAADALEQLGDEPAAAVQKILAQKDRAVMQLRDMRKHAPQAVAEMGKAYLDDLLSGATAEGGFGKTDAMFAKWQSLGPATKRELFADALKKNPDYLSNLDQFFLAAKSLNKSMNPSGSGYAIGAGAHAANLARGGVISSLMLELGGAGLAAALRSPNIARVLARGTRLPVQAPAATAAYLESLAKAFQSAGLPVPALATATRDKQ